MNRYKSPNAYYNEHDFAGNQSPMTADRVVMLAVIAALVVERLWGVPEPKPAPAPAPTKQEAEARADHAYLPARMYVRRCAGEGKDFVLKQADDGLWQAACVDARLGMPSSEHYSNSDTGRGTRRP